MKYLYFILFSISFFAQTKCVVVEESRKPPLSENILVENENIETTSSEDGIFYINTNPLAVIITSFCSIDF